MSSHSSHSGTDSVDIVISKGIDRDLTNKELNNKELNNKDIDQLDTAENGPNTLNQHQPNHENIAPSTTTQNEPSVCSTCNEDVDACECSPANEEFNHGMVINYYYPQKKTKIMQFLYFIFYLLSINALSFFFFPFFLILHPLENKN